MGFDSEAVVQICVLCAEKGTHETLSIRCAMEPLLELERDTIIQYLRRTADNNGLYIGEGLWSENKQKKKSESIEVIFQPIGDDIKLLEKRCPYN